MPCLEFTTNARIADKSALMRSLSDCVCTGLGKAETYMMVLVNGEVPMLFGGSEEPVAYLTLRALNLKPEAVRTLAVDLTRLVQERLGIESQRVHIVFMDADVGKWAWDGRTFS